MVGESLIPLGQIVERRIDASVTEYSRGRALIHLTPGAVSIGMAVGTVRDRVLALFVRDGRVNLQRRKDSMVKKIAKRLAGDFTYHHRQHSVAGIAVIPSRAGRKFCGFLLFQN